MKRWIYIIGGVLMTSIVGGCNVGGNEWSAYGPYEDFVSPSFVLQYGDLEKISINQDPDDYYGKKTKTYPVNFTTKWFLNKSIEDPQQFYTLCKKHNDETYNHKVRLYKASPTKNNPRCSFDFTSLEIRSSADWDEAHPAGTSLGDIVRFYSNTPWLYIQSGYTQKSSDGSEYYQIDKLVSELTPDDMTLLPADGFQLQFTALPTLSQQHTLFVRLTADDGTVFEAQLDVDFSQR